ncbi:MAG: trehalose-phosphatase [Candidatus Altiarchaeales archaeon ex4484_96]|nr:MAG: trehalose-phosphatase [Candidatus Altiarchaeales archaeon ex4484_96]
MKHLLECWDKLADDFNVNEVFILLDCDGTLTPIVDYPGNAILDNAVKDVLRELSRKYMVAIISGRSLVDVKSLVDVGGIYYAGNHGFEISGPGINLHKPGLVSIKPLMEEISLNLMEFFKDIDGVLVENKGVTVSLHYRMVSPEKRRRVKRLFLERIAEYVDGGKLRFSSGKMVYEIRPDIDWDKGAAVRWLVDSLGKQDNLLVYVGDDRTDEDAFGALGEGDVAVLVCADGVRDSLADYFLRDVSEVRNFLHLLSSVKD